MTPDVLNNQLTVSQENISSVNVGDMVSITITGVKVSCLVVGVDRDMLTLVPLRNIATSGQSLMGKALAIDTVIGTADFFVQTQGSIPAILGQLRFATADKSQPKPKERQYYRVKADCKIQVTIAGEEWHDGRAEDISEGGLLAASAWAVQAAVGQNVYVRVFLSDGPPILICGIIRRKVNCDPGDGLLNAKLVVEFSAMSPQDKQRLVQFIYRLQLKELEELSKKQ